MKTVPTVIDAGNVTRAVEALRLFEPPDRPTAAALLAMWQRREILTAAEHERVLDAFGAAPVHPAHFGFAIGGRW